MDRIGEVTRECFGAVIQLRRLEDDSFPPVPALHARFREIVDAALERAAQAGFGREDANDIAYALVALVDDAVLSRPSAVRDDWAARSLQLHYFRENAAGQGFFARLQAVRRDPRRSEVLQAYYLALLLGFEGHYRVRGGELELMTLVEDLRRELQRARRSDAEVLSPDGERPDETRRDARRAGVGRWLAAGALGLAVLTYAGLRLSLGASVGEVASRIVSLESP